jgi:hypothetical protein
MHESSVTNGKGQLTLQGFVSNSTPLYCNAENLVGIDGCIATILKNRSDTCF